MSEEITLDEFAKGHESDGQRLKWKNVRLHEVAYKRSDNVDPQEVDLEKHIGLEHINPNNPVPNWEPLDDLSSTKRRFESGDILFAKLRPNLEKSAQPDFEGVASTDIFPIVSKDNINSKWLLYRLSSKPAYDYARRTSAGTRMPRTSWNLFSNFEFNLPPLPEQRKIATILNTVDRAIEKTEEIVDQLEYVKQGTAQDIFRNGAFQHNSYQETIVGDFPRSWKLEKLGDLVDLRNGLNFSSDQKGSGTLLANVANVYGTIDIVPSELSRVNVSESDVEKYKLKKGDIITVRSSVDAEGVGQVAIYRGSNEPVVFAGFTIRQRPKQNSIDPEYLVQYLRYPETRKRVVALGGEVALTNIGQGDLEKIEVPVPSEDEQREIVNILRMFDQQISLEKDQIKRLKRLKQGLIQDLLSGKVRTTDTNIQVPDEVAQYG